MHLLEAWTSLGPLHLARLLALPGAILVATLLPGRVPARGAALVGAAAVLFLSCGVSAFTTGTAFAVDGGYLAL